MVGCEGRGNPIRFYIQELLDFRNECFALGLDIPFIFHAGETLESNGPTDGNLFDAILLGSKRIGHGYALPAVGFHRMTSSTGRRGEGGKPPPVV